MQAHRRTYTRSTEGQEASPGLAALRGIEIYVRGLINEVKWDLDKLENNPGASGLEKAELRAQHRAYKEVLQYIKDGRGII
jgi:hypothetical protein